MGIRAPRDDGQADMADDKAFDALDTTPEASAVQIQAYRAMSGAERMATAFRLTAMIRETTQAGIRHHHPDYDHRQVQLAWQRLLLGDSLFREAFPDSELLDP